jgi:hypothetical protein
MKPLDIFTAFALGGVAGWAVENVLFGPRYSNVFKGAKIPFLPVYALGVAGVVLGAPLLADQSLPVRAVVYGGGLTAFEFLGCKVDRVLGPKSWDYDGDGSCIDTPHAILWALAGFGIESLTQGKKT